MQKAFVTGGTGFLGRHIIDVLLEGGWSVTAMVRSPEAARKMLPESVNCVNGDLTDPTSIQNALADDTGAVFHAAADTSSWAKERERQYKINVDGTAALISAINNKKIKKLVHVSSIAVFGVHHNTITETSEQKGATSSVGYVSSKYLAEKRVKDAVSRGLDAVIVNPTHIVGRYDTQNWARMVLMFSKDALPGIPPGDGNFANGRAVAEAVVSAASKGQTGENYILGGTHANFKEFLETVAEQTGKPLNLKVTPPFILALLARILSFVSFFTGKRPMITPEEAFFSSHGAQASSEKAVKDLGYRIVPVEQSIKESIDYLKESGLLENTAS